MAYVLAAAGIAYWRSLRVLVHGVPPLFVPAPSAWKSAFLSSAGVGWTT
jgi:hypothetical protein